MAAIYYKMTAEVEGSNGNEYRITAEPNGPAKKAPFSVLIENLDTGRVTWETDIHADTLLDALQVGVGVVA